MNLPDALWVKDAVRIDRRGAFGPVMDDMKRALARQVYGPGGLVDHRGRLFPGQRKSDYQGLADLIGDCRGVQFPVELQYGAANMSNEPEP